MGTEYAMQNLDEHIQDLLEKVEILIEQKNSPQPLNENPIFLAGRKSAIVEAIRIIEAIRMNSVGNFELCTSIIRLLSNITKDS